MKPDVILLVIPVALIILLTVQNRRRRRDLAAAQERLLIGATVMTGAGMFGTVVALDGDQVTLQTGPDQTSRWLRQSIVRVIAPGSGDDQLPLGAPDTQHAHDTHDAQGEPGSGGDRSLQD